MLYRILLFSVKPQHESAIGIHMSPPFWNSLSSPSPSHPVGWDRAPVWVSRQQISLQQIPFGYLFYIWQCKFPCYSDFWDLQTSDPGAWLLIKRWISLLSTEVECWGLRSGSPVRICLQCRRPKRCGLCPWEGKIPWRRKWQPTPVFLPGKSQGQRSLVGYSP